MHWVALAVLCAAALGGVAGWQFARHPDNSPKLDAQIHRLRDDVTLARNAEQGIRARLTLADKQLAKEAADRIQPPCPSPQYGADGTAGPLFCEAVDPVVLAYYRKAYPQMFKLGPNATPSQVEAVLEDHPNTLPIECDAYTLAHALNGWSFGIEPVRGCST
jgi:hypothetical protein